MTVERANAADTLDVSVIRGSSQRENVQATGVFGIKCIGPDGQVKWSDSFNNVVTTVGKNLLLNVGLGATAKSTTWYMGLIVSNGYSTIVAGDTMSSHTGWIESGAQGTGTGPRYNTAGSTTTRPAITFASASGGAVSTSNGVIFNMTAGGTVKGAFIVDQNTKAGTSGTLYSAGLFNVGDKVVTNGDVLSVTYTASA